ncbi:MAG: uroporphyrinogen-III C-methyltransferase [Nitrosomonadales bacterium]|nr:uroporphyrinogen-III C-methyltransferase [Nitrosomonadales bacterium]
MSIMRMALAAVLAVFLWQWFDAHRQIGSMQQELARRLAEMEGGNKASQVLVAQGQEAVRDLSAKVSLLEARYAETQSQRAALEALYRELSGSRDETALAEVEQMLLIAGQQLQLSANVKAALIAMQEADERLRRMDRAGLNGLRKAIGRDMDKLRALPVADVAGINFRLDNLIATVDALPLAQDIRTAQQTGVPAPADAPAQAGWQGLLREIWGEAKQLVRIENMQKRELPLLSPTQVFFLRENLKLRLLSARLALLARDEASYRRDLQAAQEWVARYFDAKSGQGALAVATLQKLREPSVSIEVPDIGASLAAVRNYRVTREGAAR